MGILILAYSLTSNTWLWLEDGTNLLLEDGTNLQLEA